MGKRIVSVLAATIALVGVFGGSAVAAQTAPGTGEAQTAKSCGSVELSGSLPAPPAGMAVQQQVTIGDDCKPELGPVRYVPAGSAATGVRGVRTGAAAGARELRTWNEMFDCCNIRMTGLYTTSTWDTASGRVDNAVTQGRQEWNREPWNAGWSLLSSSTKDDCATQCAVVNSEAHASFTYAGIFDPSGTVYANTHHSYVQIDAGSGVSCHFDVELKHTFIGWNWRRGCE
ncbi:hypothetical protein JK359_16590 [Streptomyces actinomycinicus]|uniref:Secreted protein n=1 Tax=Streptomyces actinomycinicus TaxID=1695166 RepID=A0A937EK63_9ACTN|nr:hypothetical protein [Streptomyces actinomycinicus]MBL1083569.1 hypothetical protein [Streptomyces actinomycinicus]